MADGPSREAMLPAGATPVAIGPGTTIGLYKILRQLGAGAMGEVYLAVDEQLGRKVAIKVLGERHLKNQTIRERFLREARAMARLAHPNLMTIFEAGHMGAAERPYFAMELLEGGDTQRLIDERGRLPSSIVSQIGAQAAAGLGAVARAHIVHRDVKPANLGISAQGVLKVTDFGLAKATAAAEKRLTGKGFVVGTADYIAPEQARGEELDERADVYALGCTLFHLLTGKPPFRSESDTEIQRYVDVIKAHLNAPIPDPRKLAPDADPDLADLVMSMMIKERDSRPTCDEVEHALRRALPRVTGLHFTTSPTGVRATGTAMRGERTSRIQAALVSRRSQMLLVTMLILAVAGGVFALLGR